jgi:16S rRNA (adenine1518-N6/adenine1519-N6)-dimethyltransferase
MELEHKPISLTLMLQKEVAQRLAAKPGDLSLLALSVQYYAEVELKFRVSRKDFWPEPEVDSAVIHLRLKPQDSLPLDAQETKRFFRLLKIGFAAKRKMLKKNLAAALDLEPDDFARILAIIGVNEQARAQDLSLDSWLKLFALLQRDVL